MWKEYSRSYVKNNRASSLSIVVAAFVAALLLSLLCSLFYNLWIYELERLKAEEGDWQGRIVGELRAEDVEAIESYANVERAAVNEAESNGQEVAVDIYFENMRSIFTDLPRIAQDMGLAEESVSYHYALLNLYLIRSAQDTALRWVFPFFLLVVAAACFSLVLVIHNAFAVTMNARIHQFGIFASIGATPRQIRTCLLQEAFVLCAAPVVAGSLLGILLAMGILAGTNVLLADVEGRLALPFSYHPLILAVSLLTAAVTIWVSAWIPARKLSKRTPLEAIKNTGEFSLKKKRNARVLSALFGVEGELAGNALKAQKKEMRTASLSLIFSFLAFSFMMCFFSVMAVSQRETYFEKYQDAWDVMVRVKDTRIGAFDETEALQGLAGVEDVIVYQKAAARCWIAPEEISGEMQAIGGLADAPAEYVSAVSGGWLVNAPLVILDDDSFLEYCRRIGAPERLCGVVIRNLTRDRTDPNFRTRRSLPYLTEEGQTSMLWQAGQEEQTAELSVLAYTGEVPVLREEYGTLDFYELVHFMPVSYWEEIGEELGGEADVWIRILAKDGASLAELQEIEQEVFGLLGQNYEIESENRLQDRANNDNMIAGMRAVVSVFCVLLAVIGIGNVFSNTLGFVRQRKREFARLLSVGLTPEGMKKIFCIEALVIAGKPVLIALPVTAALVAVFIKMSYMEPMGVIHEIPLAAMGAFVLAIFGFVGLAYYLGARRVLRSDLADSLRDDTVM